jgi:MFS transporter, DHA2 family, methylenomycin A resistance protein
MRATSLKFHSVPALAPEPRPDGAYRAGSLWNCWTLVAMSLGYGVVQLDVTIVNTVLAAIGTSLGGGVSELQWVVSAYTIAFAALI